MLRTNYHTLLFKVVLLLPSVSCAQEDFLTQTENFIEELCQKDQFSGAVLIGKGDQVLFEKACGEASKRFHILNNIDTKFNLGSMNKMFTAVAILQLVEQDKL